VVTVKVVEFDSTGALESLGRSWGYRKDRIQLALQLNLTDGQFTMNLVDKLASDVPAGTVFHVPLPLIHTQAALDLLRELTPVAQRLLDGTTLSTSDGAFRQYDQDAEDAIKEFMNRSARIGMVEDDDPHLRVVLAESTRRHPLLTADTTNAQLEKISMEILDELRARYPHTIVPGLCEHLISARTDRRDAREEALKQIAAEIAESIKQRNQAIQAMALWNDERDHRLRSDRHIARLAGLSHTSVQNIRNTTPQKKTRHYPAE
jgi:hypothetical protein